MFDPETVRGQFPALSREVGGAPAVYLDGPGGTQVPQRVIDAVVAYYRECNSNTGGAFEPSRRTDDLLRETRRALADFLGAPGPAGIKFAANMTAHTFALSRAIGATLRPGDEVLVTGLDHEANVSPWEALGERGVRVVKVEVDPVECTLDLLDLEAKLTDRTRVVAVGYASNAVGTINDVAAICGQARRLGALTYVDAVHYAPHGPIDVQALGCDFLVCSAYKFFGPHLGVLWAREEVLAELPTYKVRPAEDPVELGTQNHAAVAGLAAALAYLEAIGTDPVEPEAGRPGAGRRQGLRRAMDRIREYEAALCERLLTGLTALPGVRVWGIADPARSAHRTPTVAITVAGRHPRSIAEALGRRGIFVWDGDFYARALIERLGLRESGGLVRLGLVHYNTAAEVDRLLATLGAVIGPGEAVSLGQGRLPA